MIIIAVTIHRQQSELGLDTEPNQAGPEKENGR